MRALYEKLGEGEEWTSYKTALLEQNSDPRALKDGLVAAGCEERELMNTNQGQSDSKS
jgi:hypothetical protein